jgi:hypothetical protein
MPAIANELRALVGEEQAICESEVPYRVSTLTEADQESHTSYFNS